MYNEFYKLNLAKCVMVVIGGAINMTVGSESIQCFSRVLVRFAAGDISHDIFDCEGGLVHVPRDILGIFVALFGVIEDSPQCRFQSQAVYSAGDARHPTGRSRNEVTVSIVVDIGRLLAASLRQHRARHIEPMVD